MSLHALANNMAAQGRGTDSTLVHMSPREVHGLQAIAMANGGSLTINPQTGLPEAGFLENLLPALAGFALNAFLPGVGGAIGGALGLTGTAASTVGTGLLVGGATGLATGSLEKGLMAGLGAYGGAGLESGLNAAGKSALETASSAGAGKGAFLPGAETAPSSTLDRLQAGIGAYGKAPYDALKDNAMNLGLASAPLLAGSFDDQQTNAPKQQVGNRYMYKVDPLTGQSYAYKTYTGDEIKDSPPVRFGNANGGLIQHYDDGGTVPRDFLKDPVRFGNVTAPVDINGKPIVSNPNDTRSDSQKAEDYLMGKGPNPFLFYHAPPAPNSVAKAAEATKTLQEEIKQEKQGGGGGNKSFDAGSGIASLNKDTFKTGLDIATDLGLKAANSGIPGLVNLGDMALAKIEAAKGNTPNLSSPFTLDPAQKQLLANQTLAETNRLAALQASAAEQKRLEDESRAETERLKAANDQAKQAEQQRIANESIAETNRLANANKIAEIAKTEAAFKSANPSGYSIGPVPTSVPAASPMTQDPAQQQQAADAAAKAERLAAILAAENAAGSAHPSGAGVSGGFTGSGAAAGSSTGPAAGTTNGGESGGWGSRDAGARGGFLNHGKFDQRYGDGGVTGSGSIDLHVPINLGGGQGGGMGGGLGSLGGGFGGGNGIQQRGMSQPSPDFLSQQQQSLPGFQALQKAQQDYQNSPGLQAMQKATQDYNNSDEYKGFQQYAQQYQQKLGGQSSAFGGGMGGMRGGLGPQNNMFAPAAGLYGGTPMSKPSYEQYLAGRSATQQDVPLSRAQYENPQQGPSTPGSRMAEGGITALADGGMYNLGSYSDGGRLLRGPGDGVSDDIPATIGQNQPARLADGEFVVPARIVSELGNGSTEAGARKLYAMMDRVQKSRSKTTGKDKVATNTRADKYLPA